jgi:cysteine desulfurase
MKRRYFDHNATTPIALEVTEAIAQELRETYGNASSIHREGQLARKRLETARRQVASTIGAQPAEVVFTSGGTEANNIAIVGAVRPASCPQPHVITTVVEHPSVLEVCKELDRRGVEVTLLPVDRNGCVDPHQVRRSIRPETCLVSVMHANNEIGTIEPISEISAVVRDARAAGHTLLLHSDGVQALGRTPIGVSSWSLDLYSISAHKIQGPKGVGALYVRKGVQLQPLIHGGRQERGLRAGTENVAGAVGFAKATALLPSDRERDNMAALRDSFEMILLTRLNHIGINGADCERLPNTSNVRFDGVDGSALVIALDLKGFAVSSGSACSSGSIEPSHVLLAAGLSEEQARNCVRFSLGREHTFEDISDLAEAVTACVGQIRSSNRKEKRDYAAV